MITNNKPEKPIKPNIDNAIPFYKEEKNKKENDTKKENDLFESLRREVTIHNQKLLVKDGMRL